MKRNNQELKVSFLGDISLNGVYEEMYLKGKKPFEKVSEIFEDDILVVGNLECFSRGDHGVNKLKKPRLETSQETLNYLNDFNLQVACLANNHVFDHLEDGFKKTIDSLSKNKIKTVGASLEEGIYKEPLIIEEKGMKICVLNYVTEDTNPNPPEETKINVNWFNLDNAISEIGSMKNKANHVVVILHWGGRVENGIYPDWDQPLISRRLIDSGADLIVGHHSHTVQPYEKYKGKYIFYSLGNFCFGDIFCDGVEYSKLSDRQKKSIILEVNFSKSDYSVNIKPIRNKEGYIRLINYSLWKIKSLTQNLTFLILKRNKPLWELYFFKLRVFNPVLNFIFTQKKSPLVLLSISKIRRHLKKI